MSEGGQTSISGFPTFLSVEVYATFPSQYQRGQTFCCFLLHALLLWVWISECMGLGPLGVGHLGVHGFGPLGVHGFGSLGVHGFGSPWSALVWVSLECMGLVLGVHGFNLGPLGVHGFGTGLGPLGVSGFWSSWSARVWVSLECMGLGPLGVHGFGSLGV